MDFLLQNSMQISHNFISFSNVLSIMYLIYFLKILINFHWLIFQFIFLWKIFGWLSVWDRRQFVDFCTDWSVVRKSGVNLEKLTDPVVFQCKSQCSINVCKCNFQAASDSSVTHTGKRASQTNHQKREFSKGSTSKKKTFLHSWLGFFASFKYAKWLH